MIKEAIDRIAELTRQSVSQPLLESISKDYDGSPANYLYQANPTPNGRQLIGAIEPFRPKTLEVSTLTGFIDAVNAGVAGKLEASRVIHIEDHLTVSAVDTEPDKFGVRNMRLRAVHQPAGVFTFDEFLAQERFIIGMQTCFINTDGDDWDYVMKIAQNLKAGESVHAQDDGINQTVTCKIGAVESVEVKVKARVRLCAIRSFYECAPVIGEFLLRLKPHPTNQMPMIALYSLGGTRWQGETMLSIKHYLEKHLPKGTTILA